MSDYHSYAIRHKPTGLLIPQAKGFRGKGGSHVEPSTDRPKFFSSERSAKGWLTVWLKGKVTTRGYQTYNGDYDQEWIVQPVLSRKRDDMEIVKVQHRIYAL